jgi:hypothetical protein
MADLTLAFSPGISNLVVLFALSSIILLSAAVNRWIEIPCRDYFNRLAKRLFQSRAPALSAPPQVKVAAADAADPNTLAVGIEPRT